MQNVDADTGEITVPLDLYSTSQTNSWKTCIYGAPLVAIIHRDYAQIIQACCNHWDCPACGETRAREEYHRMVWGAQCLDDDGHKLYFWTLTCRGKELDLETAQDNYYAWTNVLLTSARTAAKRAGKYWAYAQVTERQKRGHPHSHIITTYLPKDARASRDSQGRENFASAWFARANESAGLGNQHRISSVENVEAASRYIAKYLFKETALAQWPPKWKRIRYSSNWPKPPYTKAELVIQLMKPQDWERAAHTRAVFHCADERIFVMAQHRMANIRKPHMLIDF